MVTIAVMVGLGAPVGGRVLVDGWVRRQLLKDSDVDDHIVVKVFISRDKGVAILVLKADAFGAGRASIQTVEILDGCDDGLGVVMGEDLHPHGQARTILRCLEEAELKRNVLGRHRLTG